MYSILMCQIEIFGFLVTQVFHDKMSQNIIINDCIPGHDFYPGYPLSTRVISAQKNDPK